MTTSELLSTTDASLALNVTFSTKVMTCGMSSSQQTNATEGPPAGASIASPIVMFLAGIVGNVLALVVLRRTKTEIRSMMFYTLVAALTWNDLIGILLTSPVPLVSYINGRRMPAADKLCRFHGFAMVCFGLSTPLIVCTMAIERSLALKCTYFYSKYCTPGYARIVVIVLWAFVLLFGALPLFGVGNFSLQYPCTWCFLDFRSSVPLNKAYAYSYAILNLVVVVVMTFCNALVMTTLCQVRRVRRKSSNASLMNSTLLLYHGDSTTPQPVAGGTLLFQEDRNGVGTEGGTCSLPRGPAQQVLQLQTRRRQNRDVELQMIWLVCAITTIFAVCWVPLMAYILYSMQSVANHAPLFGLVAVRLASLNQTINPWIYVILRKALLVRLRKLCCTRCQDDQDANLYPRRLQFQHNYKQPAFKYPQPRAALHLAGHGVKGGQGQGRNNYVHVRHQLCPSNQFVGQDRSNESLSKVSEEGGGDCCQHHHQQYHRCHCHKRHKNSSGESPSSYNSGSCCDKKGKCKYCKKNSASGTCPSVSSCSRLAGSGCGGPTSGDSDRGWSLLATDGPHTKRGSSGSCSVCRLHKLGQEESSDEGHSLCSSSLVDSSQSSSARCDSCVRLKSLKPSSNNNSHSAGSLTQTSGDHQHHPLCFSRRVSDGGDGDGDPDGAYVDFFLRPRPESSPHTPRSSSNDVTQDRRDVSKSSTHSKGSSRSTVSRGVVAVVADGVAGVDEVNLNGSLSEADDNGYASKVSTDSSRMSTPENQHRTGNSPSASKASDAATAHSIPTFGKQNMDVSGHGQPETTRNGETGNSLVRSPPLSFPQSFDDVQSTRNTQKHCSRNRKLTQKDSSGFQVDATTPMLETTEPNHTNNEHQNTNFDISGFDIEKYHGDVPQSDSPNLTSGYFGSGENVAGSSYGNLENSCSCAEDTSTENAGRKLKQERLKNTGTDREGLGDYYDGASRFTAEQHHAGDCVFFDKDSRDNVLTVGDCEGFAEKERVSGTVSSSSTARTASTSSQERNSVVIAKRLSSTSSGH